MDSYALKRLEDALAIGLRDSKKRLDRLDLEFPLPLGRLGLEKEIPVVRMLAQNLRLDRNMVVDPRQRRVVGKGSGLIRCPVSGHASILSSKNRRTGYSLPGAELRGIRVARASRSTRWSAIAQSDPINTRP